MEDNVNQVWLAYDASAQQYGMSDTMKITKKHICLLKRRTAAIDAKT